MSKRFSIDKFRFVDDDYASKKARTFAGYNVYLKPILEGRKVAFRLDSSNKIDRFSIPTFWKKQASLVGKRIVSYLHEDRSCIILKAEPKTKD
jgi:hypothetical protein